MHLIFRNSDVMNRPQILPFVLQLSDCTRNFNSGWALLLIYLKQSHEPYLPHKEINFYPINRTMNFKPS